MVNSLVFIYNKEQIRKTKNLPTAPITIVSLNKEITTHLKREGLACKEPEQYPNNISIEKEATDLLNSVALSAIKRRGFLNFFEEYNTHVLDLLNYFLFYDSLYCKSFTSKLEELITISNILDTENPQEVILMGIDSFAEDVIKPVLDSKKIKPRIFALGTGQNIKSKVKDNFKDIKGHLLSVEAKRIRKILRKIYWESFKPFKKEIKNDYKKKALMFCNRDEIIYNPHEKTIKKGELFEPIIGYLPKSCQSIILDIPLDYKLGARKLPKGINDTQIIPIEEYTTLKSILRAASAHKKTLEEWNNRREEISKILFYKSISLNNILLKRIDFFFRSYLLDILIDIETIRNLIKKEDPNLVCSFSPQSFIEKTTINYCSKRSMPSLGIQHGAITYCIDFVSKLPAPKLSKSFAYMSVFGGYYKDFLVRNSIYNRDLIRVTGYPKFDTLNFVQKNFKKECICKELGIDPKKKIIVLTTQPLQLEEETKNMVYLTCRAIKDLDDAQLIVKVHPREISLDLHREAIKNSGVKNVILIKGYDINKILFVCDVLVTAYSTTILEASILDKPSIIIDLYKKGYADMFGNHKSIRVSNNEFELKENIKQALYGEKTKKAMKQLRKRFVYSHCYKIDGNSNKRIALFIQEILEKRTKTKII